MFPQLDLRLTFLARRLVASERRLQTPDPLLIRQPIDDLCYLSYLGTIRGKSRTRSSTLILDTRNAGMLFAI